MLALSLPFLGVSGLEITRSALELKFLGMLGPSAIDAVVTVNQTFRQVFMMFVIATVWGASSIVAQRVGARDMRDAGRTIGQALGMLIAFSFLAGVAANVWTTPVLVGLGIEGEGQRLAAGYLRWGSALVLAPFLTFGLEALLQATGDVITPLIMVVISTGLNMLCNWLFIFGIGPFPELGVLGVAVASFLSSGVALSLGLYRLTMLHGDLGVHPASLILREWRRVWRIARLALPVWLQVICRTASVFLIFRLVGEYGATSRAGYGVGVRIDLMLIGLGLAFSGAAATVAGQNKGAGLHSRAVTGAWVSWMYYTATLLCFTVLFWWKAEAIVGFINTDPEIVAVGSDFLRITSAVYPLFAAAFVFSRSMQGAGDMWTPTIITVATTFGIFVPLALWLPGVMELGVRGIFVASAVGIVVAGVLQVVYFHRGRWRHVTV